MKIILVEDDEPASAALSVALRKQNYSVEAASDGETALELATMLECDLILLDLVIPKLDGISLCRKLREQGYQKPILLLTAKDSPQDIVTGLDAGADDYVVKPYNLSELMARIRALLRRGTTPVTETLTWLELCLNPVSGEVTWNGQSLGVTATEYKLLELFLRNPQRVFSRSAIIDRLWSFDDSPTENAVTVHIKDLRQKFKAIGIDNDPIETVYGLGYRLKPATEPNPETPETEPAPGSKTPTPGKKLQAIASIAQILEKYRPRLNEQIALLRQAYNALAAGELTNELQERAIQEAHKLAGSLGPFGYLEGSNLARKIEYLLMSPTPLKTAETHQLEQLTRALAAELTKPPTEISLEVPSSPQAPTLLVVDSDRAIATALNTQAANLGMGVESALTLTAARQAIAQTTPDLILLDIACPETSTSPGEKAGLRWLQEVAHQFPTLPILVFTALDNLADRVAVSRCGGRGFLLKPASSDQILKAIAQVLPPKATPEAKVLIVDDDPTALAVMKELLQPWGLEVTTLDNPEKFWEILTAVAPDLLILDLEMPKFNGIDLCQVVRQDPDWGDLPILVVTAHTDAQSLRQVFAVGADDFIGKPIVGPELVTRITSRIERDRFRQQLEALKHQTKEKQP
ncbi:response regulator [Oscillatoria acuminata]|uniref:Response regulator with CheY-like receiver domain and winged-helix DNA-binding domain n=1 Tax=Oscillatoria acuminata PCC 6304 TaxID=56110 RepID=K9TKX4_9CYAN|nr:response regulator [Oscillatoria acuminata]AFY83058.1 response regulator with CheY-like receiver domain and winged-helix DNA-binding domain [Oscillatoria acuminata PCC 6304]